MKPPLTVIVAGFVVSADGLVKMGAIPKTRLPTPVGLVPVTSQVAVAVPLATASGQNQPGPDAEATFGETGENGPVSELVSCALNPGVVAVDPAVIGVVVTQTLTPEGMLLNVALSRVPKSDSPAVKEGAEVGCGMGITNPLSQIL